MLVGWETCGVTRAVARDAASGRGVLLADSGGNPRAGEKRMARRRPKPQAVRTPRSQEPSGTLRVIGGTLRGQPIRYLGDPRTRPMKQRVREAAFNLLGSLVEGAHVLDLFAGTGALTWEAISRGARSATLLERHFPSARLVQQNAQNWAWRARCRSLLAILSTGFANWILLPWHPRPTGLGWSSAAHPTICTCPNTMRWSS